MSEVKQAIAIVKEKLSRADKNNLGYHRFSIAEMEAIWGVLAKSASEFAELEAQRDALAAENAAMTSACRLLAEECAETAGEADITMQSIKTPVTDAYLNSVRAEGIQMLLNKYAPHTIASSEASEFAAQLRAGEPS